MVWGTIYSEMNYQVQIVKYGPKKSAPECPFECGGGMQKLFGQCPNKISHNLRGASLTKSACNSGVSEKNLVILVNMVIQ